MFPYAPVITALLGHALLCLLLVLLLGAYRIRLMLAKKASPTSFNAAGADASDKSQRFCRAQINAIENLGLLTALVVIAHITGQKGEMSALAYPYLAARYTQSITHVISTSKRAIQIRFLAFIVSTVIMVIWGCGLIIP